MPLLQLGSAGPIVTELQDKLRAHGFDPGQSTGFFNTGTVTAVRAFQLSVGLKNDGQVGNQTASALGLVFPPPVASLIPAVTPAMVCHMFPNTPPANIEEYLPVVLNALVPAQLASKTMVLMALGTIRAETEGFVPICEGQSPDNTSPGGHPFDLYDNRLGNQGKPDGELFKGRGFVQLTGRENYQVHGTAIGLGNQLIDNPDLANDPNTAAQVLASFLKSRQTAIQAALDRGDLTAARTLVNGGSNGLDRFTAAYNTGISLIPDFSIGT